jgi:holliday junction DNA helicase RuvA
MIASLSGKLASKEPTAAVVDVAGVGYLVQIPLSTFTRLGNLGEEVQLYTHLSVRENAMELFGFNAVSERELFERLIEINGVGPRLALSILSGMEPDAFRLAVVGGDDKSLSKIPGVGKKTAGRLIMELRESFEAAPLSSGLEALSDAGAIDSAADAVRALVSLGLGQPEASAAVRSTATDLGEDATTDVLVREALRRL